MPAGALSSLSTSPAAHLVFKMHKIIEWKGKKSRINANKACEITILASNQYFMENKDFFKCSYKSMNDSCMTQSIF